MTDALPLALLAMALGARHGLDADHVAAIDGLTRHNAAQRPRLAASCGALFALGHGSVVLAVAALGGWLGQAWSAPTWLQATGAWISISLLLGLGLLNLRAGWGRGARGDAAAAAGAAGADGAGAATAALEPRPLGLRGRLFARVLRAEHPAGVAGVGAAFAVSFDTVSQTLLLVAAAAATGGPAAAGVSALLFVGGMLLVDGAGGWWAWRLFRRGGRADGGVAQRLSLLIGAVSVAMALLGIARLHLLPDGWWSETRDLALTAALVLLLPLAVLVVLARQRWRARG